MSGQSGKLKEQELLLILKRSLVNPEGRALLELLQYRLELARMMVVKTDNNDLLRQYQGEARFLENFIRHLNAPVGEQ